jgi:hypothetical protein
VVWGIIAFVVFAAVISWLIYASNPPPPDDALAIRLAADLGAARPSLVEEGPARWWWFALPTDRRTDVLVANRTVRVRRMATRPISPVATLLSTPLVGRDQEMYASRTLVPGEGGLVIGGHPHADLEGWELRVNAKILETMRELGLSYVRVESDQVSTGVVLEEPMDAEVILDVADFVRRLEELFTQELH